MIACRAFVRRCCSFTDVSAVPASPFCRCILLKHLSIFHVGKKLSIPCFVTNFGLRYLAPDFCDLRETFLVSHICKTGIKCCPLKVLSICSLCEVLRSGADNPCRIGGCNLNHATFEELEKPLCVFFFIVCCISKNPGYLFESFLFGLGREIAISVPCLRFTCK